MQYQGNPFSNNEQLSSKKGTCAVTTKETIVIPKRRGSEGVYSKVKTLRKVHDIRDKYQLGKKIGEGSFGQVRLAVHKELNL